MKTRIARYLLTAAGALGLAGTPALFAYDGNAYLHNDMRQDYRNLARTNADIRWDRNRLRDDVEDGRYFAAWRDRWDLRRDYAERGREARDLRRDEFLRRECR